MGKAVIQINIQEIIDKITKKKASDDTSLEEFQEHIDKTEKITKALGNAASHTKSEEDTETKNP